MRAKPWSNRQAQNQTRPCHCSWSNTFNHLEWCLRTPGEMINLPPPSLSLCSHMVTIPRIKALASLGRWRQAVQEPEVEALPVGDRERVAQDRRSLFWGQVVTVGPCLFLAEGVAGHPPVTPVLSAPELAFLMLGGFPGTRVHLPLRYLTGQPRCWCFQTLRALHGQ